GFPVLFQSTREPRIILPVHQRHHSRLALASGSQISRSMAVRMSSFVLILFTILDVCEKLACVRVRRGTLALSSLNCTDIRAKAGELERILVIDDDAELCDLVAEYLEPDGFAVESANDPQQGLDRALGGGHAMIVLDVMMPGINGFDVLRRLRANS